MSPTIELTEPGYQSLVIPIAERWSHNILGIGRKSNEHIAMVVFRDPPQALSRLQVTIVGVETSDVMVLWVRDGGPIFENYTDGALAWKVNDTKPEIGPDRWWKPSAYGTWLNQGQLSPHDWTEFRVSDVLTFGKKLEYQPLAGYLVRHSIGLAGKTNQDTGTVSYSAAEVWRQESRRARTEGTMLLTVPSSLKNIAIIQEIDSTAELILGADPGELQDAEGTISLQDQFLFEQGGKLREMIGEAMVYDREFVGAFAAINGQDISLTLRRRIINNEPPVLFAWLALNVKSADAVPDREASDWKADAIKWANDHPWLAAIVGTIVAVAIALIKLAGD